MTGSNLEFKIYAIIAVVLSITIGFIIFDNSIHVFGPGVPIQHIEFSEISFNNSTYVITVNATLKVTDINTVNPKYRKMYFEVKGPYEFNQAKIFSLDKVGGNNFTNPSSIVNLTAPIELIANIPSTIEVNLDRSITSGNYCVGFKLPNDGSYFEYFTIP